MGSPQIHEAIWRSNNHVLYLWVGTGYLTMGRRSVHRMPWRLAVAGWLQYNKREFWLPLVQEAGQNDL